MIKSKLSERDICTKYITPAISDSGWNENPHHFREEAYFTAGRIRVRGKLVSRGKGKRADYILYSKPTQPIAVIEAKDNTHSIGEGNIPVYGSNGIVGYHDQYLINSPCIIIGRKGSSGALNICYTDSWTTDVAYYCFPPKELDLEYIYISLKSSELEKLGKGIKPGLNRNEAYLKILSIPPLVEQKRIVAKVDQLMHLCDELETRLNQSKKDSEMLMQAVLYEAFS